MSINLINDHWDDDEQTLIHLALEVGERSLNSISQTANLRLNRSQTPWSLEVANANAFRQLATRICQRTLMINDNGAMVYSNVAVSFRSDGGHEYAVFTFGPVATRLLNLIETQKPDKPLNREGEDTDYDRERSTLPVASVSYITH